MVYINTDSSAEDTCAKAEAFCLCIARQDIQKKSAGFQTLTDGCLGKATVTVVPPPGGEIKTRRP